jgi:hypothetical protein
MLYQAYQAQRDLTAPARAFAGLASWSLGELPDRWTDNRLARRLSAGYEMVGRARLIHERPAFGIDQVMVGRELVPVREELAVSTPFSSLLHFAKDVDEPQPKVLLVTALAGHFSTLLRSTVRSLSADHDVYATDWLIARDVAAGSWVGPACSRGGSTQPSINVIKSLAQALNLSVGDLLAQAADIVTDEDPASTTEASIRRDPRLNDSQESALLAVYSSMVDGVKEPSGPADPDLADETGESDPAGEATDR